MWRYMRWSFHMLFSSIGIRQIREGIESLKASLMASCPISQPSLPTLNPTTKPTNTAQNKRNPNSLNTLVLKVPKYKTRSLNSSSLSSISYYFLLYLVFFQRSALASSPVMDGQLGLPEWEYSRSSDETLNMPMILLEATVIIDSYMLILWIQALPISSLTLPISFFSYGSTFCPYFFASAGSHLTIFFLTLHSSHSSSPTNKAPMPKEPTQSTHSCLDAMMKAYTRMTAMRNIFRLCLINYYNLNLSKLKYSGLFFCSHLNRMRKRLFFLI